MQADVGKSADVAAMFQAIGKALGRLDILVNNAAIGKGGPLLELSEEDFDAVRPQPACAARLPGRPMTAPDQFAVAGAPPAPIALQPPLGGLSPPADNMAGLWAMAAADLREATTTAPDSPRRSHGAR